MDICLSLFKNCDLLALAGWFRWLEHCSVHQKVVGLIPGQGTYLGFGFNPHPSTYGRQLIDHCFSFTSMCLSPSLSPSSSLSKIYLIKITHILWWGLWHFRSFVRRVLLLLTLYLKRILTDVFTRIYKLPFRGKELWFSWTGFPIVTLSFGPSWAIAEVDVVRTNFGYPRHTASYQVRACRTCLHMAENMFRYIRCH